MQVSQSAILPGAQTYREPALEIATSRPPHERCGDRQKQQRDAYDSDDRLAGVPRQELLMQPEQPMRRPSVSGSITCDRASVGIDSDITLRRTGFLLHPEHQAFIPVLRILDAFYIQ